MRRRGSPRRLFRDPSAPAISPSGIRGADSKRKLAKSVRVLVTEMEPGRDRRVATEGEGAGALSSSFGLPVAAAGRRAEYSYTNCPFPLRISSAERLLKRGVGVHLVARDIERGIVKLSLSHPY